MIPVYCSSIYFQGYVAQAFKQIYKDSFDHYLFIGDDLILNPVINESNYRQHFRVDLETCFIPRLSPLAESKHYWSVNFEAILYNVESPGVEAQQQMPSYEEAEQLLERHGIKNTALKMEQIWKHPASVKEYFQTIANDKKYLLRALRSKLGKNQYQLTYPLVRSYADIFLVSKNALPGFSHYCGVTATTRLFAELGVPTSLAFAAKKIVTEKELNLRGRALWTKSDLSILDQYQYDLTKLLSNFPAEHLYLHPVKLSKWKISS